MNVMRCAVLALSLCALPVAAQDSSRFENAAAGFALTKPAGWRFVSQQEVAKSHANTRVSDEEMQKFIDQGKGTGPLVAMIKNEVPPSGNDPNLQVMLLPLQPVLAAASPKEILEVFLPPLKKAYPDFALESPIRELKLSGRAAAEYVATYTLQTKVRAKGGSVFPVRGRMIVVPRGKFMFVIGMISPRDGDKQAGEELAKIVSSITIKD
jgi:hypothetical protein